MAQKKLIRFAALKTFPNVLEYPENMQGRWSAHFGNNNPLTLELACGRGEYTVGLSALHPERNYIGVDVKGNRIYIGAKRCLDEKRSNAAFLRTQISMLSEYFAPGAVSEIWLTFPDPQIKPRFARKRLTHPQYLSLYSLFLQPGAAIHLKTDSPRLYHFTRKVIELFGLTLVESLTDVYAAAPSKELQIKTYYEGLDIAGSNKIFYACFRIPPNVDWSNTGLLETLKNAETEFPPT